MGQNVIGVHVKSPDTVAIRQAMVALFQGEGFSLLCDMSLSSIVTDEALLPDDDDWYGVVVSGITNADWVSLYVRDWPDSGALARGVSLRLNAPTLEIWIAEDRHWGYTYFESGVVHDRFVDDPRVVADTPVEAADYIGRPSLLQPILALPVAQADAALSEARRLAGQLPGPTLEAFMETLGLPYERAALGYDDFFDQDPDDLADDLEDWPQFRHLAFSIPEGREGLTE